MFSSEGEIRALQGDIETERKTLIALRAEASELEDQRNAAEATVEAERQRQECSLAECRDSWRRSVIKPKISRRLEIAVKPRLK